MLPICSVSGCITPAERYGGYTRHECTAVLEPVGRQSRVRETQDEAAHKRRVLRLD